MKKAIEVHENLRINNLFIIMMNQDNQELSLYQKEFKTDSRMLLFRSTNDQNFNLAFLSLCNHSIIINSFGAIGSIFNSGEATVHKKNEMLMDMQAYIYNWYVVDV